MTKRTNKQALGDCALFLERKARFEQRLKLLYERSCGDNLELDTILKENGRYSAEKLKTFIDDVLTYYPCASYIGAANKLGGNLLDALGSDTLELPDNLGDEYAPPAWLEDYLYCVLIELCASAFVAYQQPQMAALYERIEGAGCEIGAQLEPLAPCKPHEAAALLSAESALALPSEADIAAQYLMDASSYIGESYIGPFADLIPNISTLDVCTSFEEPLSSSTISISLNKLIAELDAFYMVAFNKSLSTLHTSEEKALIAQVQADEAKEIKPQQAGSQEDEEEISYDDFLKDNLDAAEENPEFINVGERAEFCKELAEWRAHVPYAQLFEEHYRALRRALLGSGQEDALAHTFDAAQLTNSIRAVLSRYGLVPFAEGETYAGIDRALSNALYVVKQPSARKARRLMRFDEE